MNRIENKEVVYYYKGYQNKRCDDYLYGFCHLFALCLREVFQERAEIRGIWQHQKNDMTDYGFLAHAYVVIDGIHWVDCRGIINQDILIDEYIIDLPTSYELNNAEDEIIFHMKEEMFDPFEPKEKEQILAFIEDNIFFYEN